MAHTTPNPDTQAEIAQLQRILASHRKTLGVNLEQQATFGKGYTPPHIFGAIDYARAEIDRIKACLRQWGVHVEDMPNDVAPCDTPTPAPTPASAPTAPAPPATPAPNPFLVLGRITDPSVFFGRERLMQTIFDYLRQGMNLSLVGERMMGKSSLLEMIVRHAPQHIDLPPANIILIDMAQIQDHKDFYEALCDELGIPTVRGSKLVRALRGKRYVLCLDEIEQLKDAKLFPKHVRHRLRGLSEGTGIDRPFKLVIASNQSLYDLFPDAPGKVSPLANLCHQLTIPPFTADEARALLRERLTGTGITFSDDQIAEIIRASNGSPAHLQQAAAKLYAQLQGR